MATQQFLTVKFSKQPNCCDVKYNRERRCLLFQMQTLDLRDDREDERTDRERRETEDRQLVSCQHSEEEIQGPLRGKTSEDENSL
jgi:hypothetical protein